MASQARFILSKIARNEAEGKADPRDAKDKNYKKICCQETTAKFETQRASAAAVQQTTKSKRDR